MPLSYPRGRRNVLVVAAHPDDDAIGCGGTLARLNAAGLRVAVTYVTDGSASHPRSRRFGPDALRAIREREAVAALRCLGIRSQPQFLRAPDSGLAALDPAGHGRLVTALTRRIAALRPAMIFLPWLRDPHPDHVVTAQLAVAALANATGGPQRYYYGVWLPLRGAAGDQPQAGEASPYDVRLRPGELERKRRAIAAHRSQHGAIVDDDPDGFRIDAAMLAAWLEPSERLYCSLGGTAGRRPL